jgi:hypothetical protein
MSRPKINSIRFIPDEIVESRMMESMPTVLYKYRSWTDKNHKASLIDSTIWFSSPKSLNDLFDIRLSYDFDGNEVFTNEFYQKLQQMFPSMTNLIPRTRDYEVALQNHYDHIKADPQLWFHERMDHVRNGNIYDQVGLFSTTTDARNKRMWAYYGDAHKGYCVGYYPYAIFKSRSMEVGKAIYIDKPLPYTYIKKDPSEIWSDLFIKDKEWEHEDEYRFLTFVESENDRLTKLDRAAIKEIILGKNISAEAEEEIVEILKEKYQSAVSLYKIEEGKLSTLISRHIPY